jgi:hypothetical protein
VLVGDILIAEVLAASLAVLRHDSRAQADLFAQAPPDVQESARKFFSDVRNKIDIRQGFTTEPPKNAMIVILLAGEEETNTPLGGVIDEGYEENVTRDALTITYQGIYSATAVLAPEQGVLRTEVIDRFNQKNPTRIPEEEFSLTLANYASLTLLRDAINSIQGYAAEVNPDYASLAPSELNRQKVDQIEFGGALTLNPTVWGEEGGTLFRGTWKITAMSLNANVTLWLHAFIKWALLKARIQLEIQGLHAAQLAGGDFEPVPEWMANNDVAVFSRGVLLTAIYAAQFVDRTDVTPIKYTDVHEYVPRVGFIDA